MLLGKKKKKKKIEEYEGLTVDSCSVENGQQTTEGNFDWTDGRIGEWRTARASRALDRTERSGSRGSFYHGFTRRREVLREVAGSARHSHSHNHSHSQNQSHKQREPQRDNSHAPRATRHATVKTAAPSPDDILDFNAASSRPILFILIIRV